MPRQWWNVSECLRVGCVTCDADDEIVINIEEYGDIDGSLHVSYLLPKVKAIIFFGPKLTGVIHLTSRKA